MIPRLRPARGPRHARNLTLALATLHYLAHAAQILTPVRVYWG